MTAALRILRLLAVVIWVGGLVFFAFVVAPVAFSVLPSAHLAGTVVAGTLHAINEMGLICFFALIASTVWLRTASHKPTARLLIAQVVLLTLMAFGTMAVQWGVVPRMERDRLAAGGDIDAAPAGDPARQDFERLHPLSEKLEGAVLFGGLGVLVLMGVERP